MIACQGINENLAPPKQKYFAVLCSLGTAKRINKSFFGTDQVSCVSLKLDNTAVKNKCQPPLEKVWSQGGSLFP